jgi:cell wall assembly regulator SMI1
MKKAMMLGLLAIAAGAAQAGTFSAMQENDCKLVTPGQLSEVIQKVGKDTGLNLPKDMAIRTELHCAPDAASKRFVYTIRAAIEKLVNDGEQQRWAHVAQLTGYGTTANGASLLREVRFTVRDVIRQEP